MGVKFDRSGSATGFVTPTGQEILTNKDIDGGSASDTSRITIPKDTKANLDALARKEGTVVYSTDLAKAFIDNGTSLIEVGSGSGSGEVNFISNPDAETNTDGWATYVNTAQSTPVTGTGGSANITFTSQTGTALRGSRSFKLTKDAANRQGEGASYDFVIGEQDQSRKLKIQFDFKTNEDAAYATGDLTVYIYDVDNSQLITPVDTSVISGAGIFQTSFNSTTSTNYRLIFHVATTNASAWDVYIDDVIVGPGMTSQGAAVGPVNVVDIDTTDFTNDAGLSIDGRVSYQRVGDSLYVTFSAETNGNGTDSGALTFDLATAINQNITFISGAYGAGIFGFYNSPNADRFPLAARFVADGTGTLQFTQAEGDVSSGLAGTGFGQNAGDRDIIQITAMLPVAEWAGKGIVPMLAEDNLSEWQSFTPSNTQGFGTISSVNLEYRRVGDSMDIRGEFTAGTTTASEAQIGLPSGCTVGGTGSGSIFVGHFGRDTTSVTAFGLLNATNGDTYINFGRHDIRDSLPRNPLEQANASDVSSTSERISIFARGIPIQEWAGSQNSLVGYSEASSDNLGLVKKNKWQINYLSSAVTTDGTISDLTFNNLEVGKLYRVTWQARFRVNVAASDEAVSMEVNHDSTVIGKAELEINNTSTAGDRTIAGGSVIFEATASSVTFSATSADVNSPIQSGNGEGTWSMIEELNNYETETTDFT